MDYKRPESQGQARSINSAPDENSKFNRRDILRAAAASMAIPAIAQSTTAFAKDKLAGSGQVVAFSYGGLFTQGIRKHVYDPFTEATGIKVVDVIADVSDPQVKAMNQAGRVDWDTAFLQAAVFPPWTTLACSYPSTTACGILNP
ncbi:spermidine/putrescine-binding protein [Bradyrhizobium sp. F1.13.1]